MFTAGIHVMGCWVANRFRTNWDHSSFRQTLNSIGGSLQSFHRNTRIPECKTAGNHLAKITEDWFEPVSARPVPCIFWDLPHVEAYDLHRPDILHNIYIMIFDHLMTYIENILQRHGKAALFGQI